MKRETKLTRRETLLKLIAGGGALSLSGCGLDARSPAALAVLELAETLTRLAQRALLAPRQALAREYRPEDISSYFRPNGSTAPDDPDYQDALAERFRRLAARGRRPGRQSAQAVARRSARVCLAQRRSPATIASKAGAASREWKGARLASVLAAARLKPAGALHRLLLRRHARTVARRQWPLLRDDRSRRRRASADDPRLRDERRAAAGRARRAAAG